MMRCAHLCDVLVFVMCYAFDLFQYRQSAENLLISTPVAGCYIRQPNVQENVQLKIYFLFSIVVMMMGMAMSMQRWSGK